MSDARAAGGVPVGYIRSFDLSSPPVEYAVVGRFTRGHVIRRIWLMTITQSFGSNNDVALALCRSDELTAANFDSGVQVFGEFDTPLDTASRFGIRIRASSIPGTYVDCPVWIEVPADGAFLLVAHSSFDAVSRMYTVGAFAEWKPSTSESEFSPLAPGGFAGLPSATRLGES